jgi:hypothetical protein
MTFSAEEQQFLVNLLERTLNDLRIEEHRTRAPTYRQHVLHDEELLSSILSRLRTGPRS